jgi:hypothetical protein
LKKSPWTLGPLFAVFAGIMVFNAIRMIVSGQAGGGTTVSIILLALLLLLVLLKSGRLGSGRDLAETEVIPGVPFELSCGVEKPGVHVALLEFSMHRKMVGFKYGLRCQAQGYLSGERIFWRDIALGEKAPGGIEKSPDFEYKTTRNQILSTDFIAGVRLGTFKAETLGHGLRIEGVVTAAEDTEFKSLKIVLRKL